MQDKILAANLPSSAALSYIGDSRHALFIRKMLVERGISKASELNRLSLEYVTAEAQASAYGKIEEHLTEEERDTFRRAFNSTHLNKPKHASHKDYRTATGFEAVIGMLYWLGEEDRIARLMEIAYREEIENDSEN